MKRLEDALQQGTPLLCIHPLHGPLFGLCTLMLVLRLLVIAPTYQSPRAARCSHCPRPISRLDARRPPLPIAPPDLSRLSPIATTRPSPFQWRPSPASHVVRHRNTSSVAGYAAPDQFVLCVGTRGGGHCDL